VTDFWHDRFGSDLAQNVLRTLAENGVVNVDGGRISQDTTSRAQHPRPVNLSWAARHAYLTTLHVVARCPSRVYPKMCVQRHFVAKREHRPGRLLLSICSSLCECVSGILGSRTVLSFWPVLTAQCVSSVTPSDAKAESGLDLVDVHTMPKKATTSAAATNVGPRTRSR